MSEWNIGGKHVLVTGGTSGIGLATAVELARRGASVTLSGRDRSRGSAAVGIVRQESGNADVHFLQVDFTSMDNVQEAAREFLAGRRPLHVLVNNAGILNTRRRVTVDSLEEMFAVNYLAPVLLTRLLLPRLQESGSARIVHVASGAHRVCPRGINFLDINHGRHFKPYRVYGHSKLANLLFSAELARRLDGTGVTSNAVHPGVVSTGLGSNNGLLGKLVMRAITPFIRSVEQGAETVIHLVCAPELTGISGRYFIDREQRDPSPVVTDVHEARRLWELSDMLLDGYL